MLTTEATSSEKTSISQFLCVLESFLNEQQIASIGPFRIDLQTRGEDNSRVLVVQSEVNLGDTVFETYCLSRETQSSGSETWELENDDVVLRSNFLVEDLDNIFPAPHNLSQRGAIEDSLHWNGNMSSGPSSIFSSESEPSSQTSRPTSGSCSPRELDGTQCSPVSGFNCVGQLSLPINENGPLGIPSTLPHIDKQFNLFMSSMEYPNTPTTLRPLQALDRGFDAISYAHHFCNVSIPAKASENNTALPSLSGDIFLPQSLDSGSAKVPSRQPNSSSTLIVSVSRKLLHEDYLALLESELPRWTRDGVWQMCLSIPSPSTKSAVRYKDLEQAYSSVCQLDVQMGNDAIKHRMALIRLYMEYTKTCESWKNDSNQTSSASKIGRGDATLIIDAILERIHEDWKTLDHRRRSDLRAKFHNRKKYGKRWAVLVDVLGFGILLLCSVKVANIVKNTTVTAKTLEAIARRVQTSEAEIMRILTVINPLSDCLFANEGYSQYDGAEILWQIHNAVPTNTYE